MRRTFMSWAAVTVLSVGAAVSLTACSSDGDKPAPNVAGDQGGQGEEKQPQDPKDVAEAYAKCMRKQGQEVQVDEFGRVSGSATGTGSEGRVAGENLPKVIEKCDKEVPGMKQLREKGNSDALEQGRGLAKCLRENGIPNMADPDPKLGALSVPKDAAGDKWTKAMGICGDKFPGAAFVAEQTQ
ncbi:hypothetical protein Stsp02_51120 [Streptomyces sp. NBRC 14336]|uniref:Lipoprotein n=1 Tax=Streptomyces fuscus TaxID=3048495 RepID=A0ABT7IW74_9ACTN|nr:MULTISPECIES: hypothetical protein [Streptomyces]MCM1976559.1 hypothetical protein [Streptomyces sp. G1]MDL2076334.1 hypothetical protein [Streptomyces fuscus]GLW49451.1 hypothetical protein Stsp02_51120 [Streptomyces sp. NBRC 14336]SBT89018.1 hypothetical protein GA0115233_100668 [Streptomyces sp. DI166]